MARTKDYKHFCAAARSLEVIGEKWTLLIVRDLLRGPQRFSDLLRYLGPITPKWLSARLREMKEAGIVERDAQEGRREVWYGLTEVGRAAVGRNTQIGTLEPGKLADLVLIEGDPLTDSDALSEIRMVIKNGQIVVDKR